MNYKEDRKAEVLDKGKNDWDVGIDADGDYDRFLSEFVAPLRELKAEGLFDVSEEVPHTVDGKGVCIGIYSIIGAINYNR